MRIDADTIIYAYLFICAALMVFNLFYIFRSKARKEKQHSRVDGWRREIAAQFAALEAGGAVAEEHKKRLARRLRDTNALVSYCGALEEAQAARPANLCALYRKHTRANAGSGRRVRQAPKHGARLLCRCDRPLSALYGRQTPSADGDSDRLYGKLHRLLPGKRAAGAIQPGQRAGRGDGPAVAQRRRIFSPPQAAGRPADGFHGRLRGAGGAPSGGTKMPGAAR